MSTSKAKDQKVADVGVNTIQITKLDSGYYVEHQRGTGRAFALVTHWRHSAPDIDEAFRLGRKMMDAPDEEMIRGEG